MSDEAYQFAVDLRSALQPDLAPFLDERDVRADDPWAEQILDALTRCTAAVILLTKKIVGLMEDRRPSGFGRKPRCWGSDGASRTSS